MGVIGYKHLDQTRKEFNGKVLGGKVLEHSDDGRGQRLIFYEGEIWAFDDGLKCYRKVSVWAGKWVE